MHKVLRMVLWKTCTSGSKAGDCVQIKLWRAESKHCTKEHSNSYFRTLKSNCKLGFQLKKNKNSFRLFAHVACSLLLAQPSACLLHLSEDGAQRTSEVPCDTSTPPLHFCGRFGSTSGSGKWSGAEEQWSTASYAVWRIDLYQHRMQALWAPVISGCNNQWRRKQMRLQEELERIRPVLCH